MAKHSISEAAKLTGKNRSTLHRHIQSGKLSKEEDEEGNPVIDTSELQRVYGKLKLPDAAQQSQSDTKQQPATPDKTAEMELLKLKLQHAEEKLHIEATRREEAERRERETKEEMSRLVGIIDKQTYLLAAPKPEEEQEPAPKKQEAPKPGFWQRVLGGTNRDG